MFFNYYYYDIYTILLVFTIIPTLMSLMTVLPGCLTSSNISQAKSSVMILLYPLNTVILI